MLCVFLLSLSDQENFLKAIWKFCSENQKNEISLMQMQKFIQRPVIRPNKLVNRLVRKGWLLRISKDRYQLTPIGMLWGRKIVRLHRLWEVYLVEYCGLAKDRVHPLAEEMEHIITPQIEKQLNALLQSPKEDPHKNPIPESEEYILLNEGGANV